MGKMLATLSQTLVSHIMSQPLPPCTVVSDCCGLSETDIKNKYNNLIFLQGVQPGEEIIEARTTGKTISFRMLNGLCLAGYCFEDREDI
jgi:hypothetical protein